MRLTFCPHAFYRPDRGVYMLQMILDFLHRHRIAAGSGLCQIGIPQSEDGRLGCHILVGMLYWSIASATFVIEKLQIGASREICYEIDLIPQLIQFSIGLLIQDQFAEQRVVAEISHYIV